MAEEVWHDTDAIYIRIPFLAKKVSAVILGRAEAWVLHSSELTALHATHRIHSQMPLWSLARSHGRAPVLSLSLNKILNNSP